MLVRLRALSASRNKAIVYAAGRRQSPLAVSWPSVGCHSARMTQWRDLAMARALESSVKHVDCKPSSQSISPLNKHYSLPYSLFTLFATSPTIPLPQPPPTAAALTTSPPCLCIARPRGPNQRLYESRKPVLLPPRNIAQHVRDSSSGVGDAQFGHRFCPEN
jgi:hypothetical protein